MGVFSGPETSEGGLVYCFDPGNSKNFPDTTLMLPPNEHGYAEWYCFVTNTVTYSIVSAGVSIVEKQGNGTITTMVGTSSGPTRGTFTITSGRTYYGVGGPINLVVEDQHHSIAPLTMAGTQFWHFVARSPYENTSFYAYSPYKNTTVGAYINPANGIISTPTGVGSLSAGAGGLVASNGPTANTSYFFYSTEPILMTVTGSPNDKTILSPAARNVYQRYTAYNATVIGTTPSAVNNACVSDPSNAVMTLNIADGAGGDCAQGLGLEFLSNTYSWGNVLSDYVIAFPYTATVVVSYWNGSAWVVWDTHSNITGDLTNPTTVARDGTLGPGVTATNISGSATNMASGASLWKWEGTAPFYLCINDSADDEFSVLGWMSTRVTTRNNRVFIGNTISGEGMTVVGSQLYNSAGYYAFPDNQITNYLMLSNVSIPVDDHTISVWFRSRFPTTFQAPFTYSVNGNNELLLYTDSSTIIVPHTKDDRYAITVPDMQNKWCNFTRTRVKSTGYEEYYMNGVSIGNRIIFANQSITSGGKIIIGQEADADGGGFDTAQNLDGDFGLLNIYNRTLSPSEVQMLFNSTRGRFGV